MLAKTPPQPTQILQPVKASEWLTFTPNNRDVLKIAGAIPVNDALLPLWSEDHDVYLVRGGRGSSKSHSIFDRAIEHCLSEPYFKCYYGRKIFDTVRGSCFDTLCDNIEALGKQHLFHYSRANTSSMIVTCKNGNKFIPFGSDKADKLKSIKDPTHIICEEFDQFTFDDFKELFPTIRTIRGWRNKFYAMFNTHKVYPDHWIMRVFFPELYKGNEKNTFDALENVSVRHIFANYTDNYFIDQVDFYNRLKLASGGNAALLEAIANGAWGMVENNNPWLYAFDRAKHVKPTLPFLPTFPVYMSFDFNNNPFEATAWQFAPQKGMQNSFIHGIKEFTGAFKVEEMCQRIKAAFPTSILFITGDRSGQNEDLGRNQTLYQMIAAGLGLSDKQIQTNSINLEHADSRLFCNALLSNYPNFYLSAEGCPNLIRQCEIAKVNDDSNKPHQLLKDRELYKMDAFDSLRYMLQTHFHEYAMKAYFKALGKRV